MSEGPLPSRETPPGRRPLLGYAMVLAAATLWAVNGTVSKVILASGGISAPRLAEVRATGAFVALLLVLALLRPSSLRLSRRELPFLVAFGVLGLALVQWFYFAAIERLEIGIALLIQYTAPLLVALWARFVAREYVRPRVWAALALALCGLTLIVDVWRGLTLDGLGVAAAVGAALAFAAYVLMAERGVGGGQGSQRRPPGVRALTALHRKRPLDPAAGNASSGRDAPSLVLYGSLFAALFWAAVLPWWSFPAERVGDSVSLLGNLAEADLPVWLLIIWMIVLGTIIPFGLLVGALRHLSATKAGIAAMWEPVAGTLVAFLWLDESLGGLQIAGGIVVLAAIVLAQTARERS